ncbi:hypothetical protein HDF26_003318 [Pedobacter cryoconitis]|uniref:Sensor of ECF-type sigma factor n=1 Tax=Pedobacter cryoconitis TaxID=188932 RepID=A0A7W8ZLH3_9SPHI|nr:hypothetical protein [Pedobacter cryoconitis]MBB5636224.1 hypothetical protein [Pedobacter cryoconitis]MBB6272858.1 hypothetical protein [Pedobacter cryoconitis]
MKNLIAIAFLLSLPFLASAQRNEGRGKEIQAYKNTYLKDKLELNPEEAKIFWPIYNAMQHEQNELRQERRKNMISFRKITEIENLSDTEVESLINNELNFKQKDLNIDRKYYNQLKKSLPIKVVGKYYRAEQTFKKELLSRYKEAKK